MSAALADTSPATVLIVDDEPNVLSALQRAFHKTGYRLLCANSGPEALRILEGATADVVISDARMPEMSGPDLLKEIGRRQPDSIRILLTGFADLDATVTAVNDAKIYRYVSKPWNDAELQQAIRNALQHRELSRERERLHAVIAAQNETLQELNTGLERRVRARTAELEEIASMWDSSYHELKRSYETSVRVFSSLIGLRKGLPPRSGQRLVHLCRQLAQSLELSEAEVRNITMAAALYDIGKLTWSDERLHKPSMTFSPADRETARHYPELGESILMALDPLEETAQLIRSHQECYDGSGYPDGLAGEAIPMGARILKLVIDYEELQHGAIETTRYFPQEALTTLQLGAGSRYDPALVQRFAELLEAQAHASQSGEHPIGSARLEEGMVLSRDLYTPSGILLLTKGKTLTRKRIERIRACEAMEDVVCSIYVERASSTSTPPS